MLMLAHQGGWDEALFVAIPLVLFALLLGMAKRRAEREGAGPQPVADDVDGHEPTRRGDAP